MQVINNPEIAVNIKTFRRPDVLSKCLDSIEKYLDISYKIYLADDGELNSKTRKIHEELVACGHYVKHYQSPTALTVARNDLIREMKNERFVLKIDDDFIFTEKTDIKKMRKILDMNTSIGAVAGIEKQVGGEKKVDGAGISINQGYLIKNGDVLNKLCIPVDNWHYIQVNNIRYAVVNFTRNFLLIRREVFKKVCWEERLYVRGEHLDFMMSLQKAGYLLVFTPDVMHIHLDRKDSGSYRGVKKMEKTECKYKKIYKEKWGIKEIRTLEDVQVRKFYIIQLIRYICTMSRQLLHIFIIHFAKIRNITNKNHTKFDSH